MRKAALIAAVLLLAGCGPKAIIVGSRPFPTGAPVFSDASGKALEALPPDDGTIRLVFLEFPWCPACADVWSAMRAATAPFPSGIVHVYRVLFDRETLLTSAGRREVPPLHPAPLPEGFEPAEPAAMEITALTAFPDAFRKEFRVSHGPLLLLLDADGKVERRWIGFSAGLSLDLSTEIRKRSRALSPRPPGT